MARSCRFRWLISLLFAASVSLGFGASSTQAAPNTILVPVDFILDNPCTHEAVAFSGTLNTLSIPNPSNLNSAFIMTIKAAGVGLTSDTTYQLSDTLSGTLAVGADYAPPLVNTVVYNIAVTSQGQPANFFLKMTLHVTIRPDGTPIVDWQNEEIVCR